MDLPQAIIFSNVIELLKAMSLTPYACFELKPLTTMPPKEAGQATSVVWGTKGSVVGRLFQSWALEVTFFSWRRSNK